MSIEKTFLKPFGVMLEAGVEGGSLTEISSNELRELFNEHQIVVLRNFADIKTQNELIEFSEQWGQVSLWPFGKVLELTQQENPQDHIFDNSYVPLHWDGMYREEIPEFQIFQCVYAPKENKGGRTTFSHTPLALKTVSESTRALWQKATGHYQRKMEFYDSEVSSAVITPHPFKNYNVIRYNETVTSDKAEGFINHPQQHFSGIETNEVDDLHNSLRSALYSEDCLYSHEWRTGDIVIADNLTLLHGREAFEHQAGRHLRRVQVLSEQPFQNPGLERSQ